MRPCNSALAMLLNKTAESHSKESQMSCKQDTIEQELIKEKGGVVILTFFVVVVTISQKRCSLSV